MSRNKVDVITLLETRVRQHNMKKVIKKLGNVWRGCTNYDSSPKGRIWLGGRFQEINLAIIQNHEKCIHCSISDKHGDHSWLLTMVYGLHTVETRKPLWRVLENIVTSSTGPLIVLGDFNAVIYSDDIVNGNIVSDYECQDMSHLVVRSGLQELKSVGFYYSWSNKGEGNSRIGTRIDRGFDNSS